jgi:murein L,D-transpeptidase YcbB/YkuD
VSRDIVRKSLRYTSFVAILAAAACDDQTAFTQQITPTPPSVDRAQAAPERAPVQSTWSAQQAGALEASIKDAERHGLDPQVYLRQIRGEGDPQRDASLTAAALAYGQALANGVVDPSKIDEEPFTLERNKVDVAAGLQNALASNDVGRWLASLPPSDREYKALSDAYLRFKRASTQGEAAEIPEGALIHPGERDARVPQIAAALRNYGLIADAGAPAPDAALRGSATAGALAARPQSPVYTRQMADAVKALQTEYGLKADGIVGKSTLEFLNTGSGDRARQLAVNLERRRWLARDPGATRIDVNTAASFLRFYNNGEMADSRRVVNGQPDWPTPQLSSPLFQLVANPAWHVPKSIAEKEIRPKGAEYMAKEDIYEKDGELIQRPGPDSALGIVKFDLKNDHAIYLHDTGAKKLFAASERHLSHGCVRVDHALEFGQMIADFAGKREAFDAAIQSGETKYISLGMTIPVRLMYHTAFVDDAGQVGFRPDVYGWDAKVAKAMGLMPSTRLYALGSYEDMGP